MGKFSNKSKAKPSKRKTLKQKYKIQRKVREFKRKTRRTARKLRSQGGKRGGKKQQTLPNLFPFKTEIIEEAKAEKEYMQMVRKRKDGKMQEETEHQVLCKNQRKWFREQGKLVEMCDVVVEVLDARDPQGCRMSQVEREVVSQHGKKLVLLLNKVDLVGMEVARAWQKELNKVFPTVMYRSLKKSQSTTTNEPQQPIPTQATPIGHGYLLHLLKTLLPEQPITIGVMGFPGVGKTSFLQSLKLLSPHPHPTTTLSKDPCPIPLTKTISILDTVQIFTSHPLPFILQGQTPSRQLVNEIVHAVPSLVLTELYRIQDYSGVDDFLIRVAKATGQLQKGGIPDVHKTVKLVCGDWKKQRIEFRVGK